MEGLADVAHNAEVGHVQEEVHAHSSQEVEGSQDTVLEDSALVEEAAVQVAPEADSYTVVALLDQQDLVVVHALHKALVVVHSDLLDHLHLELGLHSRRTGQKQVRMQLEN